MIYNERQVGTRRADFVVENRVIVELKAVINLENEHVAQAKNYVVAYDFPIGLLINFGSTSLEFKKCLILNTIRIDRINRVMVSSADIFRFHHLLKPRHLTSILSGYIFK